MHPPSYARVKILQLPILLRSPFTANHYIFVHETYIVLFSSCIFEILLDLKPRKPFSSRMSKWKIWRSYRIWNFFRLYFYVGVNQFASRIIRFLFVSALPPCVYGYKQSQDEFPYTHKSEFVKRNEFTTVERITFTNWSSLLFVLSLRYSHCDISSA